VAAAGLGTAGAEEPSPERQAHSAQRTGPSSTQEKAYDEEANTNFLFLPTPSMFVTYYICLLSTIKTREFFKENSL
jgi:hypothetical protein